MGTGDPDAPVYRRVTNSRAFAHLGDYEENEFGTGAQVAKIPGEEGYLDMTPKLPDDRLEGLINRIKSALGKQSLSG